MTEEEKKLIADTLIMDGQCGVRTLPLVDGTLLSNYVPFKQYFVIQKHIWTQEMSDYVKDICTKAESVAKILKEEL